MERKVKKDKKEEDTCRDCWIKRFRKELYDLYKADRITGQLEEFLNKELKLREQFVKDIRIEVTDVYDEINEIKMFASDIYMKRFKID